MSAAFAQANIPQVTENQQFAVGAGVGGYDNENAIAVGASFHATSNSVVKLTVSDDSQDNVGTARVYPSAGNYLQAMINSIGDVPSPMSGEK